MKLEHDEERQVYRPVIGLLSHGLKKEYRITRDFVIGADYKQIGELSDSFTDLMDETAHIQRGEKAVPVKMFGDVVDWLMNEAGKGIYIQRYKGLGEMNPDTLWSTTLDPEQRTLLRVGIDDQEKRAVRWHDGSRAWCSNKISFLYLSSISQ